MHSPAALWRPRDHFCAAPSHSHTFFLHLHSCWVPGAPVHMVWHVATHPLHCGGTQALGQAGHFGALQWFTAVQQYSAKERERVLAAGAESQERGGQVSSTGTLGKLAGILTRGSTASPDAPLGTGQQQALALELSRLAGFSAEFELLRDTLTAALAFFSKP